MFFFFFSFFSRPSQGLSGPSDHGHRTEQGQQFQAVENAKANLLSTVPKVHGIRPKAWKQGVLSRALRSMLSRCQVEPRPSIIITDSPRICTPMMNSMVKNTCVQLKGRHVSPPKGPEGPRACTACRLLEVRPVDRSISAGSKESDARQDRGHLDSNEWTEHMWPWAFQNPNRLAPSEHQPIQPLK